MTVSRYCHIAKEETERHPMNQNILINHGQFQCFSGDQRLPLDCVKLRRVEVLTKLHLRATCHLPYDHTVLPASRHK